MKSGWDWQPRVYDIVGLLFSGAGVVLALVGLFPTVRNFFERLTHPGTAFALYAVASYFAGCVLQSIARLVVPRSWLKKLVTDYVWMCMLTEEERQAITGALCEYYGFAEVSFSSYQHLCIAPVWTRLFKRDVFVAAADFHRSLSLLAVGVALLLFIRRQWAWALSAAVGGYSSFASYLYFARLADVVMYSAFLSWSRERQKCTGGGTNSWR